MGAKVTSLKYTDILKPYQTSHKHGHFCRSLLVAQYDNMNASMILVSLKRPFFRTPMELIENTITYEGIIAIAIAYNGYTVYTVYSAHTASTAHTVKKNIKMFTRLHCSHCLNTV